jgi:RNA polymerase sigma factor (sigma-70 family)
VLTEKTRINSFAEFFRDAEPRIRHALVSAFGPETGRESAADAIAYGWERWDAVSAMDNAVGYLYVYGRGRALDRLRRRRVRFEPPSLVSIPEVEPGLGEALAALPERQRVTVMLLHCFDWSMSEVADLLGISKSTVQNHAERGLGRLRRSLGVTS